MLSRLCTAAVIVALTIGLTACIGSGTTGAESAPTSTANPRSDANGDTATDGPSGAAPTCQNMLSAALVAEFTEIGWTAKSEEFRINGEIIPQGIQCLWADFTVPSDHGQVFGWAPIDAEVALTAQQALQDSGWILEAGDAGTYITENPEVASELVDGYGMTYLFGDGWVTLADTKQNLILIAHP